MELRAMLQSDDPRERLQAVDRAMKFLKDNAITATMDASTPLEEVKKALPTAEELERLMTMTPD